MTLPKGAPYSAALHLTILVFLLFGLPDFLHRHIDPEPQAISVDILPIAPMSNIKPQETPPDKTEKKPLEEKKTERKAQPKTVKEEKTAPEPTPVSAKDVVKEKKKEPDKKKLEKKKDNDLDSILKSVKDTAKADESKKPTEEKAKNPDQHKATSTHYDPGMPLSMSEKDAIRSQFQKCWVPPAGAKDLANLAVTLHFNVDAAGTVTNVEMAHDTSRYNSDSFFRAAADSAIRAVKQCSPLKNLPADKIGSWGDMELTFDPKDYF